MPWPDRSPLPAADAAACSELLRGGSRSFHAASFLLPPGVRRPASALYAFCRLADDAVDLDPASTGTLAWLHGRLARIYAGRPDGIAADRALAAVVRAYAVPRELPEALLEGFAWDAAGRRYETLSDVLGYAARVAGTVGAMMALLMGVRDPGLLARAADLGVAMQLTNIARDVGEDAAAGRLYLPRRWLREAGIEPDDWLAAPAFSPALAGVVGRLLETAEGLYRRADSGIAGLPAGCRPGIYAARLLYAEIGHELARGGFDSVTRRAVVPAARKARVLAGLPRVTALSAARAGLPPLPETGFLVEAVAAMPPSTAPATARRLRAAPAPAYGPGFARDFVRVLELFERLELRERRLAGQSPAAAGSRPGSGAARVGGW